MNRQFYFETLNQIRGLFCVYIIFHNLVTNLYQLGLVSLPVKLVASLGQEVVIGFFLMSGFLTFFSLNHKYSSYRKYVYKRWQRIYIPLTVSLIVSVVIAGMTGNLLNSLSWSDFMGNLLLLQDFGSVKPGTWFYPFLGNLPLWSLSYQWWFYLLVYPVYQLLPKNKTRVYLVGIFCILFYVAYIIYPNQVCLILAYFILGWLGVELGEIYFNYGKLTWQNTRHCLVVLGVMVLVTLIPNFWSDRIQLGYYPFLIFRHFFTGLFFVGLSIIAFQVNWKNFATNFLHIFTKIYPISYGLYILHYPILVQWGLRNAHKTNQVNWGELAIALICLIIIAYFAEVKLPKLFSQIVKRRSRQNQHDIFR